jgi:phage baseplate assembly protein W
MASSDLQTSKELKGLALPALKGTGGYFESKGAGDVSWGDLLLTLFTPIGGRVMRRSFGSSLYDLLFEPLIPGEFQIIGAAIRDIARRQLPHVRVTLVQIRELQSGIGMEIKIFFRLQSNLEAEQSQTVLIPKTFIPPTIAAHNTGL